MKPQSSGPIPSEILGLGGGNSDELVPRGQDRFLLETLMDNIPDGIYFKDKASRFLCVNRAQADRFRVKEPAELIGKTDQDFFGPEHAQQALADEQEVMRTGDPLVGIEEKETWPDGRITWVSTTKVPLRDSAGQIIGTFGLSRDITLRKRAELALAERTRQLQQRTQQMEEQMRMARELQLAMLPQRFPTLPDAANGGALEFFSFFLPSGTVSGDFFDVVELSPTRVGVFICDVMGHDVRAALITGMMRALVEDLSAAADHPGKLLSQMNHGLVSVFKQSGATMYATAFYLIADVAEGRVLYSSAAHPDPIHLRRRQGTVEFLAPGAGRRKGPALGLFEKADFPTFECELGRGDILALFTDGLIETESISQEQFSAADLLTAARRLAPLPASEFLRELIAEVLRFSQRDEFDDDVCLVGMEVKP